MLPAEDLGPHAVNRAVGEHLQHLLAKDMILSSALVTTNTLICSVDARATYSDATLR